MDHRSPTKLVFVVRKEVNFPLKVVWSVIGDFGTEHRWTKTLVHCERDTPRVGIGTSRTCELAKPLMGRRSVQEQVIEFAPEQALAYCLDGAAGPFRTASSRWTTDAKCDSSTMITVEGRFTPQNALVRVVLWPLLKPFLSRLTGNVLSELESFLFNVHGQRCSG